MSKLEIILIVSIASFIVSSCSDARDNANDDGNTVAVETYARAEALMGPNLVTKVFNYFVKPHWIGTSDEFWYRSDSATGHTFVVVDARTGNARPAFDHNAVASSLSQVTEKLVEPNALPFKEFSFDADRSAISFLIGDLSFNCQLNVTECITQASGLTTSDVSHDIYFQRVPQKGPPGVLLSPDERLGVETRTDNNLWLLDFEKGVTRQLTSSGEEDFGWGMYPDNRADYVPRFYSGKQDLPANTQWSPDSRLVLVPLIDQRHVAEYPFIESVRKDGAHRPVVHPARLPLLGERPATFVWYLIDVVTGEQRLIDLPYDELILIQQDFIAVRELYWNDDSSKLYMAAHGDNLESGFLFEIDTATGDARTVIYEEDSPRMEFNSTTYNAVNVRLIENGEQAIWWSQRDGWGHLYRYDTSDGTLINQVTKGEWLVREIIEIDEDRERIFFTAGGSQPGNPYYRHLYRVQFDGSDLTLLTPEDADHMLLPNREWVLSGDGATPYPPISPSGEYVVYNYSRVNQPTRFAIRRVHDASLIAEVAEADAAGLYAAGWRPPEEFMVLAPDGKSELWGTIYKPSDFDPNKTYPIIDAQYASPLTAITPRNFYQAFRGRQPLWPSSVAELGFIVVSLDSRGTTFRSKAFSTYGFEALNLIGLGDHVHAITELAKERPYMDIDRVGITGHSYGGYAAVRALLEFPEFYKVGISSAGPADMHALYNDYHTTAYHGKARYSTETEWMGDDVSEVPVNHQNLAASLQADKLKGKILIQFGELDENVPPNTVLGFIDALIAANKDFDMLYLPNRDHQFIGEGYIVRRNWDYLVRHLGNKEPPYEYNLDTNAR